MTQITKYKQSTLRDHLLNSHSELKVDADKLDDDLGILTWGNGIATVVVGAFNIALLPVVPHVAIPLLATSLPAAATATTYARRRGWSVDTVLGWLRSPPKDVSPSGQLVATTVEIPATHDSYRLLTPLQQAHYCLTCPELLLSITEKLLVGLSPVEVESRLTSLRSLLTSEGRYQDYLANPWITTLAPGTEDLSRALTTATPMAPDEVIDATFTESTAAPLTATPKSASRLTILNLGDTPVDVPQDPEALLDWLAGQGLPIRRLVKQALVVFNGPSQSGKSTLAHMVNVLRIYYGVPVIYLSPDDDVPQMPYDQVATGDLGTVVDAVDQLATYIHSAGKGSPEVGVTLDEVLKVNKHASGAGQKFIGELIEKGAKANIYATLIGQAKTMRSWGVEGLSDAIRDSAFLIQPDYDEDEFGKRTPKGSYRVERANTVEQWGIPKVMLEGGDPVGWLAARLGVDYVAHTPTEDRPQGASVPQVTHTPTRPVAGASTTTVVVTASTDYDQAQRDHVLNRLRLARGDYWAPSKLAKNPPKGVEMSAPIAEQIADDLVVEGLVEVTTTDDARAGKRYRLAATTQV